MKKLLIAVLMTLCLPSLSYAQQANASSQLLPKFPPGFISPNGNQLNKIVDIINTGEICPTFYIVGAPTTGATDSTFFIANRAYRVISARETHGAAAGGASVIQVTKDTGTNAPGAGTDLLTNNTSTGFDLNATANTVQTGTFVTTAGALNLAVGDRLGVDFANAIQSSSSIAITVCLAPLS